MQNRRSRSFTKRADDRVQVKVEKEIATFSVHSPTGISQATIHRTGGKWPKAVILRLHLKGLEKFHAAAGKIELHASVSTQTAQPRSWSGDKENAPLDSKSPYWIDVRLIGGDGKPAKKIPLEGGYFELRLPPALFDENPKAVTLNWIDFYRN